MGWGGDLFYKHSQRWYQKRLSSLLREQQEIQKEIDVARRKWGEWAEELFVLDDAEFEKKKSYLFGGWTAHGDEETRKLLHQKKSVGWVSDIRKLRKRTKEINELISQLEADMQK